MANKIPEFDLFKRMEHLEEKTKGKFTIGILSIETYTIAVMGLGMAWLAFTMHDPEHATKYKDDILKVLKVAGINKELLDSLDEIFSEYCSVLEQK